MKQRNFHIILIVFLLVLITVILLFCIIPSYATAPLLTSSQSATLQITSELEKSLDVSESVEEEIKVYPYDNYNNLTPDQVLEIMQKIQQGDVSYIEPSDSFPHGYERFIQSYTSVLIDVNNDGYMDLVIQELPMVGSPQYYERIQLIIAYQGNSFKPVFCDLNDAAYTYFITDNGLLIFTYHIGGNLILDSFTKCDIDLNWNLNYDYMLQSVDLRNLDDKVFQSWSKNYEFIRAKDIYYIKCSYDSTDLSTSEQLTKNEFSKLFKDMTGYEYINE